MQKKLLFLFQKYISGTASMQEKSELSELVKSTDNESVSQLLKNAWEQQHTTDEVFTEEEAGKILQNIIGTKVSEAKVVPIFRRPWVRIAAAVIVIFSLAIGYRFFNKKVLVNDVAKTTDIKKQLLPGGNKAILTLANGSQIILDTTANGLVSSQGQTKILKLNSGQLSYEEDASEIISSTAVLYNSIATPKGGQYQIVLSDGSKVWLNAESSLRFPAQFSGNERRVELTGEAYFEVAKNKEMPFKVAVNNIEEVEVLGTHFNINAYDDEATIRTTLLEGSVKVTSASSQKIIKPGQQAVMNSDGINSVIDNVNTDHETAWKNGLFDFENDDLKSIMRQLSRWYDAQIVYNGNIPNGHYVGSIRRQATISEVLKMLELTGDVQFTVSGNKIVVKQN